MRRPTASASQIRPEEYEHGTARLLEHLEAISAPLVLFTFKKTATVLLGPFKGHGLLDRQVGSAPTFVMPGPYEATAKVERALADLRQVVGRS